MRELNLNQISKENLPDQLIKEIISCKKIYFSPINLVKPEHFLKSFPKNLEKYNIKNRK